MNNPNTPQPDFPEARLEKRVPWVRRVVGSSRMWWATLAAVLVAGYLVYRSVEQTGPEITIHFPEGHGLKVGDYVRYRGIDVGHVDRVDLSEDLTGIEVQVTLLHGADDLAREATQFWIVRPQLSLTEIRGLETAVGAKYIAAQPAVGEGNRDNTAHYEFNGLSAPPPGAVDDRGVEIVLRGDDSYALTAGAPVTWRGVDVGQVLSADLASDTRYVDVRIRIDSAYRNLLRTNSKFWATGGVGIDAGLLGVKFRAQSLSTIARGGVSFITPSEADDAAMVRPGHVFTLHAEPDDDWVEAASTVSLIDFPLPPTVTIRSQWQEKQFGFTRNRERSTIAVVLAEQGSKKLSLIAPSSGLETPSGALAESFSSQVFAAGRDRPLFNVPADAKPIPHTAGLTRYELNAERPIDVAVPPMQVRKLAATEDCCLVRSVAGDGGASSVIQSISRMELSVSGKQWRIDQSDRDLADWHGAAVVATSDGKLLGMVVTDTAGIVVAPLAAAKR